MNVKLTASLEHWLWNEHRDIFALVKSGHTELLTDEMLINYSNWCKTEEGKEYIEGGKYYHKPR